jgi:hypothetical protein
MALLRTAAWRRRPMTPHATAVNNAMPSMGQNIIVADMG